MDEFMGDVNNQNDERQNEITVLKFFPNGQTKEKCKIQFNRRDDELWKIQKRLLKKLKYKNYKSA